MRSKYILMCIKKDRKYYLRSLCILIFTLTLRPFGLSISFSRPTPHPSLARRCRVSTTMSRTSSRWFIRAAPKVSAQAHDCGHPQLRSTPWVEGATRADARASSKGSFAPNWTIVGGWFGCVETVRSVYRVNLNSFVGTFSYSPLCRAKLLRLNSLARIMGDQQRSTPYLWTVCRKASYCAWVAIQSINYTINTFPYRTIGARAYKKRSCFLAISKILSGLFRHVSRAYPGHVEVVMRWCELTGQTHPFHRGTWWEKDLERLISWYSLRCDLWSSRFVHSAWIRVEVFCASLGHVIRSKLPRIHWVGQYVASV